MRERTRSKMVEIQKILQEKSTFQVDAASKGIILKGPPIIFITNRKDGESICTWHVVLHGNLKLGTGIPWIATTDPKYVEDYLKTHKLAGKVSVISMEVLSDLAKKKRSLKTLPLAA